MNTQKPNFSSSQRGFASVLIVLLVGLALGGSVLGTAYYLKSSQKSLVASHALTNAQSGAWTGVEVLRQYLNNLDGATILSLNNNSLKLKIQDGRELKVDHITATQTSTSPDVYQVSAQVQNLSTRSEASSTIQIVYEIRPDATSTPGEGESGTSGSFEHAMNFYGGLTSTGGIKMANAGENAVINVDGNFKSSGSLTGVKTLNSTGDVSLDSGIVIENVYANGTITLNAGAAITNIASAQKEIHINSWGTPQGEFYANGNIYLKGSGIKRADTLKSFTSTVWSRVEIALAKENITCISTGWNDFSTLQAANFISCPPPNNKNIHKPPITTPQGAFAPVSLASRPLVNALNSKYLNEANYIFKYNATLDRPIVTINNVQGIPKGDYEIGIDGNAYWGHICKELNSNKTCKTTALAKLTPSLNKKVIVSYDKKDNIWVVDDREGNKTGSVGSKTPPKIPSLAPGVMLFHGNVRMPIGLFVNTILATGNIDYGTDITIYAPNYAGPSSTCNVTGYPMPLNLCSDALTMTKASIGNIALLAGSCTDDSSLEKCTSSYNGGTITLGSGAHVFGNIIAGNILKTSGSSHILGAILAAALGDVGQGNKIDAETNIDFDGVNDHENFKPSIPKDDGDSTPPTSTATDKAKIRWARYI